MWAQMVVSRVIDAAIRAQLAVTGSLAVSRGRDIREPNISMA